MIVPTHNRHALLEEALVSIASQTIDDWEVIVVDDGSIPPVSSTAIRNRFGARVHVIRHMTSQGGAAAKNTGIAAAAPPVKHRGKAGLRHTVAENCLRLMQVLASKLTK